MAEGSPKEKLLSSEVQDGKGRYVASDTEAQIEEASSSDQTGESSAVSSNFKMIKDALKMGVSFTFSLGVFALIPLLHRLSKSESDTAASAVAASMMNTACGIAAAPLFMVPSVLIPKMAEWKAFKEEGKDKGEMEYVNPAEGTEDPNSVRVVVSSVPISGTSGRAVSSVAEKKAEKKKEIESIYNYSLSYSVVISGIVATIFYFSEFLLSFTQESAVAASAQEFLRPYAFAVPGLIVRLSLEQILFLFGEFEPAAQMALPSFLVGIVVAVVLAFYAEMGPLGIALGFTLESYSTAILYARFIEKHFSDFDFLKWPFTASLTNVEGDLKELKKRGADSALNFGIDFSLALVVSLLSGSLDEESQSAVSYNLQYIYFLLTFSVAFTFTSGQRVSSVLDNPEQAKEMSEQGVLTTMACLAPIPIMLAIVSAFYPKMFDASEKVEESLQILVPIMCIGMVFDIARFNLMHQLRVLGDTFVPNAIALVVLVGGMAASTGLAFETSLGIYAVAGGSTLSLGVVAATMYGRWNKKLAQLVREDKELPDQSCCNWTRWRVSNNRSTHFSQTPTGKPVKVARVEDVEDRVGPSKAQSNAGGPASNKATPETTPQMTTRSVQTR